LFTAADRALFDAKRDGRDKVVVAGALNDSSPQLVFNRFVGRASELRALVMALDQSVHGGPQTRMIIGEAGVGKSTLVRQLLPESRLRGAVMVTDVQPAGDLLHLRVRLRPAAAPSVASP